MAQNQVPVAQAYTYAAPAGIAGDVVGADNAQVQPAMLIPSGSDYPSAFGLAMKFVSGGIQQWNGGSETKANFNGILVRAVPTEGSTVAGDLAYGGAPNPVLAQNLGVAGEFNVLCVYGTPARGGTVYVRVISTGNNTSVGTFDATSDTSNSIALDHNQAVWASDGKDASNVAVIRLIAVG